MAKNKKFKGFSLIELSIVVLIIGLIIAAVIGGKKLVNLSSLSKARALTNSSPVAGIENLSLWYESTSKASFSGAPTDGSAISIWNDINPQLTSKKNLVIGDAPTYTASAINGLPAVKFDGVADYLESLNTSTIAAGNQLTIFMVLSRISFMDFGGWSLWRTGSATDWGDSGSLAFEDRTSATGTMGWARNDTDSGGGVVGSTLSPYPGNNNPFIYDTIFNGAAGTNYSYYNGSGANFTNPTSIAATNFNIQNIRIGTRGTDPAPSGAFWNGYIGELIIFDRALSDFERGQIEQYLSKKWGIKLT